MTNKQSTINIEDDFSLENVLGYQKPSSIIDKIHRWAQARSLWPFYMGAGCCNRSMHLASDIDSDFSDFYKIMHSFGPGQADLLIISGVINEKRFHEIKAVYEQMSAPKWVMVVGACAASGGLFADTVPSVDYFKELPVDVLVPGCPPSPENILKGFEMVRAKIKKYGFRDLQ